MEQAIITKIYSVYYNQYTKTASADVHLDFMIPESFVTINLNEIPNWFGVDEQGYSIKYELEVGTVIYYDRIFSKTGKVINPRFTPQ